MTIGAAKTIAMTTIQKEGENAGPSGNESSDRSKLVFNSDTRLGGVLDSRCINRFTPPMRMTGVSPRFTFRHLARQMCPVLGLAVVVCLSSCTKQESANAGISTAPATASHARKLPDNTELSKVEGVSIVQCPPSEFSNYSISRDFGGTTAEARTALLKDVLSDWCEFEGMLKFDAELPEARYNIRVAGEEGQKLWPKTKRAFEQVFGLRFVQQTNEVDVFVLQKAEPSPKGLTPVKDADRANYGTDSTPGGLGYDVKAATMADLTEKILASYLELPVMDETGLEGYYKFVVSMNHWKPTTVFTAMEKLGLKLQKDKRTLPVMHVVWAADAQPVP
jgi:hypothetical protein